MKNFSCWANKQRFQFADCLVVTVVRFYLMKSLSWIGDILVCPLRLWWVSSSSVSCSGWFSIDIRMFSNSILSGVLNFSDGWRSWTSAKRRGRLRSMFTRGSVFRRCSRQGPATAINDVQVLNAWRRPAWLEQAIEKRTGPRYGKKHALPE